MGIDKAKDGKLIYHLTKLSNLDSIVKHGLVPRSFLMDKNVDFGDVANPEIISKRKELGLDIYTPFHFHPYSSFDVSVKRTYPETDFIYICIQRTLARDNKFKILVKHPLSINECVFHEYDEGISLIEWEILMEKGRNDDHAKHVKMAECITDLIVPAKFFNMIFVKDDNAKKEVENIFKKYSLKCSPPYIKIQKLF